MALELLLIRVALFRSLRLSSRARYITPVLLKRKAARLSVVRDKPLLMVAKGDSEPTLTALFARSIVRPIKMLVLSPIVLALSTFCTLAFDLTFRLFIIFSLVFQEHCGFTYNIAGPSYLRLDIWHDLRPSHFQRV